MLQSGEFWNAEQYHDGPHMLSLQGEHKNASSLTTKTKTNQKDVLQYPVSITCQSQKRNWQRIVERKWILLGSKPKVKSKKIRMWMHESKWVIKDQWQQSITNQTETLFYPWFWPSLCPKQLNWTAKDSPIPDVRWGRIYWLEYPSMFCKGCWGWSFMRYGQKVILYLRENNQGPYSGFSRSTNPLILKIFKILFESILSYGEDNPFGATGLL